MSAIAVSMNPKNMGSIAVFTTADLRLSTPASVTSISCNITRLSAALSKSLKLKATIDCNYDHGEKEERNSMETMFFATIICWLGAPVGVLQLKVSLRAVV